MLQADSLSCFLVVVMWVLGTVCSFTVAIFKEIAMQKVALFGYNNSL